MDLLVRLYFLLLFSMSVVSFLLMGQDKGKARQGKRRICEKALFLSALCLGAIGGTIGMFCFRHKTRHWYFRLFFPLLAVLQALTGALLLYL